MKKILASIVCVALLLTLAACSSQPQESAKHVDGELTEIFAKIYENVAGVTPPLTMEVAVDDTNKASMLGTDEVVFTEGLASEAAIMTIPHSMVLIRVDNSVDIQKTKDLIKANVDPRKWICVGVDPSQVIVDSIGDLVFLVMSEGAEAYHASFLKLAE